MSAVILALFEDHAAAERARIALVHDGFPTDRVDVTSTSEPGRTASEPGASAHERYIAYFRTLFPRPQEQTYAEQLADRVEHGAAAVTVLPRGPVETARARSLIDQAAPREIAQRDLDRQYWEHAAAHHQHSWLSSLWPERHSHAHCLYCQLFEDDSLERAEEDAAAKRSTNAAQ